MKTETIQIHFDGGCRPTNPGNKYGSWEVLLNGKSVHKKGRVEFGWGTNNEAEFEALEGALSWCVENLRNGGFDSNSFRLEMFTDSTVVKNRVAGRNTSIDRKSVV